ncbi:MAG: RNA polymerase sigma-54 factor [Planctomycetota bacterium]|nr:RNA polymerase sigma-54 factor [Planctomycetota bacterium]
MGDSKASGNQADDFERLANVSEEYGDSWESNPYDSGDSFRPARDTGEPDKKLEAIANTASRPQSLADQLLEQWVMVEAPPAVAKAGEYLIGFIDDDGYLRTPRETLLAQAPADIAAEEIDAALPLLQQSLEPVGIAARDLRECLLIQIDSKIHAANLLAQLRGGAGNARDEDDEDSDGHSGGASGGGDSDFSIERRIVSDFLKDVEVNRLPRIAKALGVDVERIKEALGNLRQFHPHPGRLLVNEQPRAIIPDAIVEFDEENDCYIARLFNGRLPAVHISPQYLKLAKDAQVDRKTRDFVGNNIRTARWLLDAIQQRQHTLLRVINVVLEAQREFFDLGPQSLKPLPMTQVADQLGIHVATVSRAVSGKYIQTPRGIFPLRMFFSGGAETAGGESMSWAAMKAKVQEIIDAEDKANPLSDDELVIKLKEAGIDIARRTIAKYRSELKIPTARQRRVF